MLCGTNIDEVGGLGLGLTITQVIVAAHQGQIAVESSLEAGTTVMLLLPLAQ